MINQLISSGGFNLGAFSLFGFLAILFIVWETVWKGFGLWHSARNRQKIWFVAILLINLVGILPIVYLLCLSEENSYRTLVCR